MDLPRFFNTYRHKRFNYLPMYYDPKKEELEERKSRIEREAGLVDPSTIKKSSIRGSFRHVHGYREKANRASAIRTLIIVGILLGLVLLLFTL
ncbi:MAG: hypothetical protein JW801_08710 [Bacteroidales bacterium]|nr:hypothetical protein [Bacteroidales bacterium]